ncbi:excise [Mycobacterium phage Ellie]|uniref:Excise n=2 Tax=Amginevirus TaxID=2946794 RepID=A0A222ZLQ3_9CAUD|nr:HTH DNA binding protein [Mycobacterium phage Amgine]YP_009952188.1 HTH DNA binding protein [Mycobacterium phage Ellie]ASR85646.1 excise [Mycobacterium phage Amgine]QNJ58268.1 excise [Mycobacterium phage Ellie]QTF82044.1 excise [Mycobacterium phage Fefferhead]
MKAAEVVVEVEPLFVTREDAARLLCLSTVELDKLRASSKLVARKYGRKVLFPVDELRRFAQSLPADQLGA